MIDRIIRVNGKPRGCLLLLPDRGQTGRDLAAIYQGAELKKTMIVGVTPRPEWYPDPDEGAPGEEVITGVFKSAMRVSGILGRIEKGFGIKNKDVVIVGFGAGAAVALQVAAGESSHLAGAVIHSGANLGVMPYARDADKKMPIITTHCTDDPTFKWDECYLPLREKLKNLEYWHVPLEHAKGGHCIFKTDIIKIAGVLAKVLGYPDTWRHSKADFVASLP
jgi:predicted esterase